MTAAAADARQSVSSASSGALAKFLESALQIRVGEGRRTALLFTTLFLCSAVFIMGRTVRDTLFLSRYSLGALPWMFVIFGATSAVTVVLYARVADRMARHKQILLSTSVGVITYLATWVAVQARQNWIYPVFYVWTDVVANLFIMQFWTLANDLHDVRAAKRLFGTIGSARVLGIVVVGLSTGAIVSAIGTTQLIFVLAGLMAAIAALAWVLRHERPAQAADAVGRSARRVGHPPRILGERYVQLLGAMLLLCFIAVTIGDYQFKAIARATYREDALARFFSLFYGGTGVVAFIFQIFGTPRLLRRFGVGIALAVMPVLFGGASATLIALPNLVVATLVKFADNGLQFTIFETTLQALYVPFAPAVKTRTRAFLDAVVKPMGFALAGIVLILIAGRISVALMSIISVALVGTWIALIPLVQKHYLRTMQATLQRQGPLNLDYEALLDRSGRRELLRALEEGKAGPAIVALEQLTQERSPEFVAAVQRLTTHPDIALRTAALQRLGALETADPEVARHALQDDVAEVRAAAAAAYATLVRDEAIPALAPLVVDEAADVRVEALAGLLRHGGVEGGIVGGGWLAELLSSPRPQDRVEATRVLRRLGLGAYRPLRRLLEDDNADVRRAALKAASGVADPRLVPQLIELLGNPALRRRSGIALVSVGPAAIAPLSQLLADVSAPRVVRLEVPRLLKQIEHPQSYAVLKPLFDMPDSQLRLRVYAAASKLRATLRLRAEPLPLVLGRITSEVRQTYRNLAAWQQARERYETPLLTEEFDFRYRRSLRRILGVLELRYDREPLRLVRQCVDDPRRRANALEVLDTLIDSSLRPLVMPFFDDRPVDERLRNAGSLVPATPGPLEFMLEQCRHPNPYVAYLMFDALARQGEAAARSEAEQAAESHAEALVREGALTLLRRLGLREGVATMHSTVEKILFLKSAPLFQRVPSEDLAPLAHAAEVQTYPAQARVVTEGEMGDDLYVIVRGQVAIEKGGRVVAQLGSGEAFGEMALLDAEPRSATATTLEETELLRIGSEEFYEVLHQQSEIAEGVIRMLTRRLRAALGNAS